MNTFNLKDRTAICGVGHTEYGRMGRSMIDLGAQSLGDAAADAGIKVSDIDGMIVSMGSPYGADVETLSQTLGLDLRWHSQTWSHGRFTATAIQHAAMAICAGMADTVAVIISMSATGVKPGLVQKERDTSSEGSAHNLESAREGGGGHGQDPVFGTNTPDSGVAMVTQTYFERYGATAKDLGALTVASRRHASMNPGAQARDLMSIDDYLAQGELAAPLRPSDYPMMSDGSICLIITSAERAKDLKKPPVLISGMQPLPVGREEYIWTYRGYGTAQQTRHEMDTSLQPVFKMAEMDQSAVDAFFTYDCFSFLIWMALERFGYCGQGEGAAFTQGGRIELGGELPINTHGGSLSEAHLMGYNHQVEIVRQLRGECGERQIDNPQVIQWANAYGDSLIYRRA